MCIIISLASYWFTARWSTPYPPITLKLLTSLASSLTQRRKKNQRLVACLVGVRSEEFNQLRLNRNKHYGIESLQAIVKRRLHMREQQQQDCWITLSQPGFWSFIKILNAHMELLRFSKLSFSPSCPWSLELESKRTRSHPDRSWTPVTIVQDVLGI